MGATPRTPRLLSHKCSDLLELALSAGAWTPCYILRMSQRDAGLLPAIGTRGLTATIINILVGTGIFAVPGTLQSCDSIRVACVMAKLCGIFLRSNQKIHEHAILGAGIQ